MFTEAKKYDGAKVPIHFRPWNESSLERKFSGTSSQERMFPTGNFRSRERKYRRTKRPISANCTRCLRYVAGHVISSPARGRQIT